MNLEHEILEESVGGVFGFRDDRVISEHMIELNNANADTLYLLGFEKERFELFILDDLEQERLHERAGLSDIVPVVAVDTGVGAVTQVLQIKVVGTYL